MKLLLENWRKFLNESKLRVFDFDDTLATTTSKVKLTQADGSKRNLTPDEFATYELQPGESYDEETAFIEFADVRDGEEIRQIANILRNVVDAGTEGRKIAILPARSAEAQQPIANFLEEIGVDSSKVEIMTLSSTDPQDKKDWIKREIQAGADDIEFFDDSQDNVAAVESLKDDYPHIRLVSRLVKYGRRRIPKNETLI